MNDIVIYADNETKFVAMSLIDEIHCHLPTIEVKSIDSITELEKDLRFTVPTNRTPLYILLADTQERLSRFRDLQDFLIDRTLLLLLPDNRDRSVWLGHQLHPRMLFFLDDPVEDICGIISQIINKRNSQKLWQGGGGYGTRAINSGRN